MRLRFPVVFLLTLGCAVMTLGVSPVAAERTYTVRSGDTLARIARRFRSSVTELRERNRLRGDRLRIGMTLRIPTRGDRRRASQSARRAGIHVVRRGDTLSGIAARYRVPVSRLRRRNRVRGDRIRIGQRLRIPGRRAENQLNRVAARPLRPDQESVAARAAELELGHERTAQNLLTRTVDERWIDAASAAPQAIPQHAFGVGTAIDPREVPALPTDEAGDGGEAGELEEDDAGEATSEVEPQEGPGTLHLPIDTAYYMRGWGSGPGGYHLAVDIGSPSGTPIRASERGIVAYASHGIRGYGRFVMIVHPNGTVTAYAHNQETLVVPGELVARGQVVSLLGNTGISRGPHLHFMLIDGGEHCDPLPLFRPQIRFRTGSRVETSATAWSSRRPDEVRCLPRSSRRHPRTMRRRRR